MTELKSFLTLVEARRLIELQGRRYRDSAEARHRMVMSLFPAHLPSPARASGKILFRHELTAEGSGFLVRSAVPPAALPGVRVLEEELHLPANTPVAFRVTVSPVKRMGGRERFLPDFDELAEWLASRLEGALSEVELVTSQEETLPREGGGKNFVKLSQCQGVARTGDSEALQELLREGVGRNKNYGAGLLTVKPLC